MNHQRNKLMIGLIVAGMVGFWWLHASPNHRVVYAATLTPNQIHVVDGDTIDVGGERFRLTGYDAAETWQAQCRSELELGNKATARLQQLIDGGGVELQRIACSCRPGTEGTMRCNYGRRCGILRVHGRDVGQLLIGEGLARSYICGPTSCPRRAGWC